MTRRRRPSSGTLIMLSALAHCVPAFLVGTTSTQHISRAFPAIARRGGCYGATTRGSPARPPCLAKGFGSETHKPVEKDKPKPRPAKSLMPLADAASKLLPKQGPDGTVKFDNPAVGDFQVLDSLVEYPGSFDLKIIGVDEEGFVSDIREAVAGCLSQGDKDVLKCSTREKGKYTSITLKVHVENSSQLYKCYEVINEDTRVKFKF